MCTIVTLLNPHSEARLLFLENRDRPTEGFTGNSILTLSDNRVVAIYDNRSQGIACGYSMNTHVWGGIANILGHTGPDSRGVLLKNVLTSTATLDGAVEVVVREVKKGRYGSAIYLLGDLERIVRIESFDEGVDVTLPTKLEVATNHFHFMKKGRKSGNSAERERYVRKKLSSRQSVTLDDLVDLGSHHGTRDSVCRHKSVLSSLVFEVPKEGRPAFLFTTGSPCEGYLPYTPEG